MSEQQSAVERLADQWNATPDWAPTVYDHGRVDQRHEMTMQLLEAIEADRVRACAAAEKPEWEYGIHSEIGGNVISVGAPWVDHAFAEEVTANFSGNYGVRRRKAGEWVPVKQEGAETDD